MTAGSSRCGSSTSNRGGRHSSKSTRPPVKAGKTSVVTLEFSDDDGDSFDDVVEARSVKLAVSKASVMSNWNVDLGCSLTMTPHCCELLDPIINTKLI